jgi:hypothetical protein
MAADRKNDDEEEEIVLAPSSAKDLPAIYVDTCFATRWAGHVRLAFGETLDGIPHYRTVILMEVSEIRRLIDFLAETVDEMEEKESSREPRKK